MERLTYRNQIREAVSFGACQNVKCDGDCDSCKINTIIVRLCAFEDIVEQNYDLARLRELVEADRDGRVIPHKNGGD